MTDKNGNEFGFFAALGHVLSFIAMPFRAHASMVESDIQNDIANGMTEQEARTPKPGMCW